MAWLACSTRSMAATRSSPSDLRYRARIFQLQPENHALDTLFSSAQTALVTRFQADAATQFLEQSSAHAQW